VRYITSPVATDLGIHREYAEPRRWSADSRRIFFFATIPDSTPQNQKQGAYSISVIGGDPALIMDMPNDASGADFSPDAREAAVFCRCGGNKFTVFFSSPAGSPWRRYEPDPFATTTFYNGTDLKFSPDGKKALLFYTGEKSEPEAWILPFPSGTGKPHRVLSRVPPHNVLSALSWMPDDRHIVFAMSAVGGNHLWLADTDSNESYQLTTGISSEFEPGVSPDGKTVAFDKFDLNLAKDI
jgi:Tol biopolymer transport system component